ncbi:SDR family oxidoreductase [Tropicimonas isoalkanivorans]|uniref:Peroxisomal trans-2-enoyl-CoA reductase n=1 Tax=Tropicimonas isoalkanivorans TaxID=441112 RepID=A0A1I1HV29_9RHOB|nr:SDR family oxidoreductase [Tropicimonas isoalkanivorans]SFC27917.1 NAD(P)-dependent dehydrogenase, short-chain alcohol dehydrogenase family [Tropicimonas isoalkanivorans]
MFRDGLMSGKKVLVTGGGSGLGRSFALRQAELGAEIVICGRRQAVLDETAQDLLRAGAPSVDIFSCDIRDAAAIDEMFDAIWAKGPLTGLINNAAGNFVARTERLSPKAMDAVLNIVLHGSLYCTTAAGRRWIEGGQPGTVLSVVSSAATSGRAFTVPSAAAKAGVLAMTKSLAVEWGPYNIRTVAVAPGLFPTEGAWGNLRPDGSDKIPQAMEVPLRRLGDHSEIANLVAYLMSDEAGYISGECVTIDGGRDLLGGGGSGILGFFDFTDAQWETARKGKG